MAKHQGNLKQTPASVLKSLKEFIREDKAEFLPGFFQAYPGGYGEGDRFLGVVVPDIRRVAKQHRDLNSKQIKQLLSSVWHECRLTAVFVLVDQYERASRDEQRGRAPTLTSGFESCQDIVEFYLDNLEGINNWDLVDASSHKLLGQWIVRNPKATQWLTKLSKSKILWEQRIAVVATFPLIKLGDFDAILKLATKFIHHPHDLMHKAVGWMLREVGKQDVQVLRGFLSEHAAEMPRTMLRYAIEKLSDAERKRWLVMVRK